jgi:hypothetical protein
MKTKFIAEDGAEFEDQSLCLAYERLIRASKNSNFHQCVEGLFHGCESYAGGGSDPWDTPDRVLYLNQPDSMNKFKANLVQALPRLQFELNAAIALDSVKGDPTPQ